MPLDAHQAIFLGVALGAAAYFSRNTLWEIPVIAGIGLVFFSLLDDFGVFVVETLSKIFIK